MSPEQLAEAIREITEQRDELLKDAEWHTARKMYESGSHRRSKAEGIAHAITILTRHQEQASVAAHSADH